MRSSRSPRRACATLALPAAVAAALLLSPAAPASASASATVSPGACSVVDGSLTWGFKESFRSYISGSIARGEWEVLDGATYETPVFGWSGGAGAYDPATATGEVAFAGGIRFTGHGGLLETTVENPTLVLTGATAAQLRVDVSGVAMEDAVAGDDTVQSESQVVLVDIDLATATVAEDGDRVTITAFDAPTVITAEGFEAFGNYAAGTPFDPLTLAITAECTRPEPAPTPEPTRTESAASETPTAEADAGDAPSAVPFVVAATAALAAVGATVAAVVTTRRRKRAAEDGPASGDAS